MREIVVQNWGWTTYLVMLAVPFVVGLLTKASWHPLLKFALLLVLSAVGGVASMEARALPWTADTVMPFLGSLMIAAQASYMVFIRSFPTVQQWLDAHLVK
jgi:hypothetical protein